jgi:hypothetical protein
VTLRALRRLTVLTALLLLAAGLAFASHAALTRRAHTPSGWARAIALARQAQGMRAVVPALRTRDAAIAAFLALARSGPPDRRSQAAMLAALLQIANAPGEPHLQRALFAQAAGNLVAAIRLDRGNDDAAYDLELLLSRAAQSGRPITPSTPHLKKRPARGRPSLTPAGTGY